MMMDEPEEEDVLELTQMVPDEEPEPPPAPAFDPFDMEPEPPPPPPRRAAPPPPPPVYEDDALISDMTASAASRAFSSLAGFKRGPSIIGEGPMGNGAATVEQICYELMRPLIREWLDDNLPQLVERLVKREIEKVVRRGLD
ncbi:MAG TPA: DUF2497 domain-containing protein [Azospirillaceae bacterium]|nr:DUF2497 domain-containing protein [Azospirillaceae bacterium]